MKSFARFAFAAILIAAVVAVCAPSPNAGNSHFVIVNNNDSSGNNYGTVLQLGGTRQSPVLSNIASLSTGVAASDGKYFVPGVQVVRVGGDVCVFLADVTSHIPNEISSFKFPGMILVGNYSDNNVPDDDSAQTIAAGGGYLFATYGSAITSWVIGSGCTLTVAQTYERTAFSSQTAYMAVTPDGKTLILTAPKPSGLLWAYSFSIGPGGRLTKHGPYLPDGYGPVSFDITADGKWVYFAASPDCETPTNCPGTIVAMSINSDGTLSGEQAFIFGSLGPYLEYLRFSPNEQYLFVDGGTELGETHVYTLNFTENPPKLTYGCATKLNAEVFAASQLATVSTTGAGGGLYVAEEGVEGEGGGVGLLTIDPSTGCTTEVPNSPFSLSDPNAVPASLVAWPPRPF